MKRLVVLTILSLSVLSCSGKSLPPMLAGEPAPFTRLTLVDGSLVTSEQFAGKPTVMVFWATWCSKSKRLMAELKDRLRAGEWADHTFFLVSVDKADRLEKVQSVLQDFPEDRVVRVYSGNEAFDETYMSFRGSMIPYVVVIDRAGTVVAAGNSTDVFDAIPAAS